MFDGGRSFMWSHLQQNENSEANNKIYCLKKWWICSTHATQAAAWSSTVEPHWNTTAIGPLVLKFFKARTSGEVLGFVFSSNQMTADLWINNFSILCLFMQHVHPCHWHGTWATWWGDHLQYTDTCLRQMLGANDRLPLHLLEKLLQPSQLRCPSHSEVIWDAGHRNLTKSFTTSTRAVRSVMQGLTLRVKSDYVLIKFAGVCMRQTAPPFSRLYRQKAKRLAGIPARSWILLCCITAEALHSGIIRKKNTQLVEINTRQNWSELIGTEWWNKNLYESLSDSVCPCSQPSCAPSPWSCVPGTVQMHEVLLRQIDDCWRFFFGLLRLLEQQRPSTQPNFRHFEALQISWSRLRVISESLHVSICEPCVLCCNE